MATVFTHAFVATALGAARPRGVSPLKVAVVLSAVAVLPDVDVLAFRLGIPYEHPLGHRGLTHSLSFAAVVGMLIAASVSFCGSRTGATSFLGGLSKRHR